MVLEFKVVIIGSVAVGKTALTNRIQYAQFEDEYQATIGAGYIPYRTNFEDTFVELQIWDTAGMERYKSLGPIYYRDASCAIIVYDQSAQETADAVPKWLEAFRETVKTLADIVVVGNKDDLENKVVQHDEIREWAKENEFDFFLTSAKTGKNVNELFSTVVSKLVKTTSAPVVKTSDNVHLSEGNKQKSCC